MAAQSNIYAGVAGYVGRSEQKGTVGVFRRPAETGRWEHVLTEHETYTVNVHPTDPNVVFAGTSDGVFVLIGNTNAWEIAAVARQP